MPLITYDSPQIKGINGKIVQIELGFLPVIQTMDDILKELGFRMYVTNSFRKATDFIKGAIVPPASMSNHLIGHAIDCNLYHIASKRWYNSKLMGDNYGTDQEVIDRFISAGIRWGGSFRKKDEVHFDDRLNLNNPDLWHKLYGELQG